MVSLRISWGVIIMLHDLHHNSTLQPMPYCTFFWFSIYDCNQMLYDISERHENHNQKSLYRLGKD